MFGMVNSVTPSWAETLPSLNLSYTFEAWMKFSVMPAGGCIVCSPSLMNLKISAISANFITFEPLPGVANDLGVSTLASSNALTLNSWTYIAL